MTVIDWAAEARTTASSSESLLDSLPGFIREWRKSRDDDRKRLLASLINTDDRRSMIQDLPASIADEVNRLNGTATATSTTSGTPTDATSGRPGTKVHTEGGIDVHADGDKFHVFSADGTQITVPATAVGGSVVEAAKRHPAHTASPGSPSTPGSSRVPAGAQLVYSQGGVTAHKHEGTVYVEGPKGLTSASEADWNTKSTELVQSVKGGGMFNFRPRN